MAKIKHNTNNDEHRELAIGTIFCRKDKTLEVVAGPTCEGCYFYDKCDVNNLKYGSINVAKTISECDECNRTDNTSVIFKEVKECKHVDNSQLVIPLKHNGGIITCDINLADSFNILKLTIPDSMVIDKDNTNLSEGIIKFKKRYINITDVIAGIDKQKGTCVLGYINNTLFDKQPLNYAKIIAIAKLMDIAHYYNKDWHPDWSNSEQIKTGIIYNSTEDRYLTVRRQIVTPGTVVFKTMEDAEAVINNPNFKEILDVVYKN